MGKTAFLNWFGSAAAARILPFALFMFFVVVSSLLPPPAGGTAELDTRLIYVIRTVAVAALLMFLWRKYSELSWEALARCEWTKSILAGVAVFLVWIALDQPWATIGDPVGFDPRNEEGEIDWAITLPRLIGLVIVVPVMEELFWRSFIQRWIDTPDFLARAPASISLRALLVCSALFALEHSMLVAGFLAGLVYGMLYMRTGSLWSPILAHAVTNGLLGAWILLTGRWHLW
jgi:CAAX prenyl protease-like protein